MILVRGIWSKKGKRPLLFYVNSISKGAKRTLKNRTKDEHQNAESEIEQAKSGILKSAPKSQTALDCS